MQGLLTSLGPLAVLVALLVDVPEAPLLGGPVQARVARAVAVLAGSLLLGAGVVYPRRPRLGQRLTAAGLASVLLALVPGMAVDPATTFTVLLLAAGLAVLVLGAPAPRLRRPSRAGQERLGGAVGWSSGLALLAWGLYVNGTAQGPWARAVVGAEFLVAAVHGLRGIRVGWRRLPSRRRPSLLPPVLLGLVGLLSLGHLDAAFTCFAAMSAWLAGLALWGPTGLKRWARVISEAPAPLLVSTFLVLGLAGGIALSFPAAAAPGREVSFLDALFTSVSASCVTGLIVLDTPHDFSGLGQAIILLLIQVGGLGVMAFSAAASLLFGRRLSLRAEASTAALLGDDARLDRALARIFGLTAAFESAGAVVLFFAFLGTGDPPGRALWRGLFTSVSAFCNAGFALQTDSLLPYQGNPLVLGTVSTLIVFGGLGTGVVAALPELLRGRPVPLQAKLVLVTTAALLVVPTFLIAALEWKASLAGLGFFDRLVNAWFQSVTLRTAGFNSVDLGLTRHATRTLMVPLMFIGGSPGSTAGGVKTTTFALLVLAATSTLRGRSEIQVFGRRVGHRSVYRAAAVATVALAVGFSGYVALQLTQHIPGSVLLFETFSALGTVGLSLGATPQLDAVGRIIVILLMFVGRVGPLSLFILLTDAPRDRGWKYPLEQVNVG